MTVLRQILRRIGREKDHERNTLIHDTVGYEFYTEILVSRRCVQGKIVHMLERSQSLLRYCNNIASLQDWYSADHGSHTPLEDYGDEPMMDLWTGLQTWRQEHRPKEENIGKPVTNRILPALIVNVETDVPSHDERI